MHYLRSLQVVSFIFDVTGVIGCKMCWNATRRNIQTVSTHLGIWVAWIALHDELGYHDSLRRGQNRGDCKSAIGNQCAWLVDGHHPGGYANYSGHPGIRFMWT